MRWRLLLIGLSLFISLTACYPAAALSPAPPVATAATAPTVTAVRLPARPTPAPTATQPPPLGGDIILGLVGQPGSLNPITHLQPPLPELAPLLYETLLQVDPQTASLQPGLATAWVYSDDGQQVTFSLPAALKWSDGATLTAADIAAALIATAHPALAAFSRLEAINDTTLRLTFKTVDCAAVTALAGLPLVRAAEITAAVPIGSGPFVAQTWSPESRSLTLTRNPHYHGPGPRLNGLTVRFLPPEAVAIALSEGYFDAVGPLTSPVGLADKPALTSLTYPSPQMVYLAVNYVPKNGTPLPPEIRPALTLALDRAAILAEALGGDGQLLAGPLLAGHWAAAPDLTPPPYNPEAARQLLQQANLRDTNGDGWLDLNGSRLELGIRLNSEVELYQNLGRLISSYYRDLGLYARPESIAAESLLDDLFTHDFRLALFRWPLLPDPDQRLFWQAAENTAGVGLNFTSYNNAQLDRLLDQAIAVTGCAEAKRQPLYRQFQQMLVQDQPVDFLLTPNHHILIASRLHGLTPGPFGPFTWNIAAWSLENQ